MSIAPLENQWVDFIDVDFEEFEMTKSVVPADHDQSPSPSPSTSSSLDSIGIGVNPPNPPTSTTPAMSMVRLLKKSQSVQEPNSNNGNFARGLKSFNRSSFHESESRNGNNGTNNNGNNRKDSLYNTFLSKLPFGGSPGGAVTTGAGAANNGTAAAAGTGAMSPNSNNSSNLSTVLQSDANLDTPTIPELVPPTPGIPTERQSLKHLSVSAPAIRTVVMRNSGNGIETPNADFVLAPSSSKSRQKKFHRHFTTVPLEETVLDYYSCAYVADILLQGYLYITENHFAFYSNVFGYVTKLLIPVTSVVRITKERTAKIIPNAVGICTRSDKHVFASLLSRDTTHKLMFNVWQYSIQLEADEVERVNNELKREEERSAEASVQDESSGESGSGNDSAIEPQSYSPSPLISPVTEKVVLVAKNPVTMMSVSTSSNEDNGSSPSGVNPGLRTSTVLPSVQLSQVGINPTTAYLRSGHRTSIVQAQAPGLNSFPTDSRKRSRTFSTMGLGQAPSLLLLATAILVILFISAAVLLSRISNLHQKVSERPVVHDSEQFYQELMAWQNKLHTSSADEIHQYINLNLQQIIRVRQSLEALSLLFVTNQPESAAASILKESTTRHEALSHASHT